MDYRELIAKLQEERRHLDAAITNLQWLAERHQPPPAATPTRGRRARVHPNTGKAHTSGTRQKLTTRWAERREAYRVAVENGFSGTLRQYEKSLANKETVQ